jgi:hypothetical protein
MLTGTLDDFDLRQVFRLLSIAHKTGRLTVAGPAAGGRIYFRGGRVYHAESEARREGFGRKLVRAGKLTELELRRTLEYCAVHRTGLGEALVTRGLVSRDDLEAALRQEIEEVVLGLFRNERGTFAFQQDEQVDSDTLIQVPVEALIEEDAETVRRRVPSLNTAFVKASISPDDDIEISITWEEWSLIALIDGRRSVGEIAALLETDDLDVMRGLRRLLTVGLVGLSRAASSRPPELAVSLNEPGDVVELEQSHESGVAPPPPPPPEIDLADQEGAWVREGRRR